MPNCQAKINNKICGKPLSDRNAKYCDEHQGYERPTRSKTDTGKGQGDTQDKTGKDQSHNMQPKGGGNQGSRY